MSDVKRVDVIVFELNGSSLYLTPQEAHQHIDNMVSEGDTSEYKIWWSR